MHIQKMSEYLIIVSKKKKKKKNKSNLIFLAVSGYKKVKNPVGHIQKHKFYLKECNRDKLITRVHQLLMDISYSSCMPFKGIYSAHMTVLLQYIKPIHTLLIQRVIQNNGVFVRR